MKRGEIWWIRFEPAIGGEVHMVQLGLTQGLLPEWHLRWIGALYCTPRGVFIENGV